MKENKIKAIGILKIVLRIVNVAIFVASVVGIIQILMPKKKTDEKVEEESENLNLDDYIDDVIDPDDYNFPEDETLENLGEDTTDSEDDAEDFEDNDDDDDDENESEELKGWDAL